MDEERLVDIEIKVAYQEDTVQALNDALCQQQRAIDQLEAKVRLLSEKMGELAESVPGDKEKHEVPPHY